MWSEERSSRSRINAALRWRGNQVDNAVDGESMFPYVSDWKVVQDDSRPTAFPQLSWLLLAVLWTSFNNVSNSSRLLKMGTHTAESVSSPATSFSMNHNVSEWGVIGR